MKKKIKSILFALALSAILVTGFTGCATCGSCSASATTIPGTQIPS